MPSFNFVILFLTVCVTVILAQNGPAPPRLNIPGALPLPLRPQFRNDKLVRLRRPLAGARPAPIPNAIPLPIAPRLLEEAKPVTEEPEDEIPENFIPQLNTQPNPQPSPIPQFEPSFQQESSGEEPRYQPQERQYSAPTNAQRFSPVPERKIVRRPVHREPRPQFDQEAVQTIRQQPPARRPVVQPGEEEYRKKPVAQILRKYREEHEDGSITWGFENDDGSYKEETIGNDCVTRGRYGYIDPDGLKREYNYETGILCDPNKRGEPELEQGGFVDYEGNKAILPNGVELDLASMGKKKSKRPGAFIPQQVQPQNIYRN